MGNSKSSKNYTDENTTDQWQQILNSLSCAGVLMGQGHRVVDVSNQLYVFCFFFFKFSTVSIPTLISISLSKKRSQGDRTHRAVFTTRTQGNRRGYWFLWALHNLVLNCMWCTRHPDDGRGDENTELSGGQHPTRSGLELVQGRVHPCSPPWQLWRMPTLNKKGWEYPTITRAEASTTKQIHSYHIPSFLWLPFQICFMSLTWDKNAHRKEKPG